MNDDRCTCQRYIVDYGDPKRINREDASSCLVHNGPVPATRMPPGSSYSACGPALKSVWQENSDLDF